MQREDLTEFVRTLVFCDAMEIEEKVLAFKDFNPGTIINYSFNPTKQHLEMFIKEHDNLFFYEVSFS